MPANRANDGVTIGEVARSVDEVKTDVRELTTYIRAHVESLPKQFVLRTEVDARESALDLRITGVSTDVSGLKADRVTGLRQLLQVGGAAVLGAIPGLAALASHAHH